MSDLATIAESTSRDTRTSKKWTVYDADVLPAWIAEMDFGIAPVIREALAAQVGAGDLGYPDPTGGEVPAAFAEWTSANWAWDVAPAEVQLIPDVMRGVEMCLQAFSSAGEPVVVTTPIYPPFLDALADYDRRLWPAGVVRTDDGWALDLDAVEAGLRGGARLILLCSPHNPTGHVFTVTELTALAELAERHHALIVSDEVHAPLVHEPHAHHPLAELVPDARTRLVTVTSASKAWNLPGLRCAQLICQDTTLRARLAGLPRRLGNGVGILGLTATALAFREGGPWLGQVRAQLDENRRLLTSLLDERLPGIVHSAPEAGYLAWLDLSTYAGDPAARLLDRGRVALNDGVDFGPGGSAHVRLNFATSPRRLREIVDRMVAGLATDLPEGS